MNEFDRSRALLAGPQSTLITQVGSLLFHPFNETSGQLVFDPADAAQYAHEREMYYAGTLDSHEWVVPVSVGLQGQQNFTPQACRFNSMNDFFFVPSETFEAVYERLVELGINAEIDQGFRQRSIVIRSTLSHKFYQVSTLGIWGTLFLSGRALKVHAF